jgi:hypothetical protein
MGVDGMPPAAIVRRISVFSLQFLIERAFIEMTMN